MGYRAVKQFGPVLLVLVLAQVSPMARATPGATDARGCHRSASVGYHCHAQAASVGAGGESTRERDKRLKRECKGRPNAGACLGYAR